MLSACVYLCVWLCLSICLSVCLSVNLILVHIIPDLGSQHQCTLYTFIVLGKIMYSNIFNVF